MKPLIALAALLLLASPAALHAAKPSKNSDEEGGPAKPIPSDLKVLKDIVYKQVGDQKLDLMIFQPQEKKFEKSPLVIYIHGGGWGGGDKYRVLKAGLIGVIEGLTKAGVTCATIEYRLAKGAGATSYDSAADCKDAVRYFVKHADEYGIDPQRIGTFGSSAGGHLTLVTALGNDKDYPCDPAFDGPPGKIRCVAAYYPLVSLVDPAVMKGNFERPERLVPIIGGLPTEKHDIALKLSPIELLRPDSPAILLAHGDADKTLTFQNSIAMRDAAQAKGVPVECIIAKGAGHGLSGANIDPPLDEIERQTVAFFLKYLTAP